MHWSCVDKYLQNFENRHIHPLPEPGLKKGKIRHHFSKTQLMGNSYKGRPKLRRLQKPTVDKPINEVLKELRSPSSSTSNSAYREQSLKIHGLICAKCAREFDDRTRHLLTVHHKDGNHTHNPPDGSNWENLCSYCHEDEHSRGILGDYFRKTKEDKP